MSATSTRQWRTPESYQTELILRDLVMPFLQQRGFRFSEDRRTTRGTSISQCLIGQDDQGRNVGLWVRLCWRKGDAESEKTTSAAQIVSNVDGGRWVETLEARMARAATVGATHLLLLQNAGDRIESLASVPLSAVVPIWKAQREESRRLIASGTLSRRKNHAENGSSPTIWLRDSDAPSVASILWGHRGVRNLARLAVAMSRDLSTALAPALQDTYDDLEIGRDEAQARERTVSGFPRDRRVREEVLRLSNHRCERPGCTAVRNYRGALDTHHILGIRQSDRVSNCVALCPNCHRDAHFHPDRDALNAELLAIARGRRLQRLGQS